MVMPGLLFAALVVATSAKNADARAVPSDPLPRDHKQIAAAQFVEEVDSVLNTLYFRPMPDDDESWDKDISSLLQQNQPPTPPEHDLTTTVVAVDEEQVSSSFYLQLSTPTGSPDEIIVDKQTEHMDNSLDKRGVDTSYASSNYISPETPDDSAIAVQTLQQGLEKTAGDVELTKQRVEDLTAEAAKDREELMLLRTEFNKLKANLLSLLTAVLLGQTNTGGTSTMASGVSRRSQDGAWTTRLMSNLRQTL